MRAILIYSLIFLGILILIVGISKTMIPPMITGVGFMVIAWLFLLQKNDKN